jgi:hypothetical protein
MQSWFRFPAATEKAEITAAGAVYGRPTRTGLNHLLVFVIVFRNSTTAQSAFATVVSALTRHGPGLSARHLTPPASPPRSAFVRIASVGPLGLEEYLLAWQRGDVIAYLNGSGATGTKPSEAIRIAEAQDLRLPRFTHP